MQSYLKKCFFDRFRSFIVPDGEDTGGGLFGNPETIGYNVVTPFIVDDTGGKAILVNRGWVSKKNVNPASRPEGQVRQFRVCRSDFRPNVLTKPDSLQGAAV